MKPSTTILYRTHESQRDSGAKPRVARNELPWESVVWMCSTPTGLWPRSLPTGRNRVYLFGAHPGLVAQICNLPYRRFAIGKASESSSAPALADMPQNAILRYSAARRCRNQSSADFQVCCVADFPIRRTSGLHRAADWEVGDTAGLETCATPSPGASRESSRLAPILAGTNKLQNGPTPNP
jgi:hypothetical protein